MKLHAVTLGTEGRPIVLLPGLFGATRNLGTLQKALAAAGRRVIALDLRNHGESPHAEGMAYGTLAADVRETLASLDALPCNLLGHSMGGKTAMRLALDHPETVARLVVADIAPVRYRHDNQKIAAALIAVPLNVGMSRAEASALLAETIPDKATRSFLLLNLRLAATERPAWRIGLAEIAAGIPTIEGWEVDAGLTYEGPTLFVAGGRSGFVGPGDMDAILSLFPGATITTLPEAGHWLHAEDPAGFLKAVGDFLLQA
jgi:esterase